MGGMCEGERVFTSASVKSVSRPRKMTWLDGSEGAMRCLPLPCPPHPPPCPCSYPYKSHSEAIHSNKHENIKQTHAVIKLPPLSFARILVLPVPLSPPSTAVPLVVVPTMPMPVVVSATVPVVVSLSLSLLPFFAAVPFAVVAVSVVVRHR